MARENWCEKCYPRYNGLRTTITPQEGKCWKCGIPLQSRFLHPLNKHDIILMRDYYDQDFNRHSAGVINSTMKFIQLHRLKDAKEGFIDELQKDSHNPYATFNKWFGEVLK